MPKQLPCRFIPSTYILPIKVRSRSNTARYPIHDRSYNVIYRSSEHALLPPCRCVLKWVQVERPHTSQQIHCVCTDEPACSISGEDFPEDEEGDDDRCSEVFLEEVCGAGGTTDGL